MSTEIEQEKSENALAGVNYKEIKPFKDLMVDVGRRTLHLPEERGVFVIPTTNGHAGVYQYRGKEDCAWVTTKEGLGNKAWIAMLLCQQGLEDPTGNFHFGGIGIDTFLMGANDNACHGGMPVILTDEVSCGADEFFGTPQANALAMSFEKACVDHGCALVQGESPAYSYLMSAKPPVKFAPSLSVNVIGIVTPARHYVSGEKVKPGDVLIGVPSSGLHANGISPTIRNVMKLSDGFLTKLNGRTVGEEALIPTRSYVGFVEALLEAEIDVHAFVPITGDGIAKLAGDNRYHYSVHSWPAEHNIPPLFRFMLEVGMSKTNVAKTYNNGIGYVVIVPKKEVSKVLNIGNSTLITGGDGFYYPMVIGDVEEKKGEDGVYFARWDLHLPPPGMD